MEAFSKKAILAVVTSLLVNAPFAIGEFVHYNPADPRGGFPLPLFIAMWIEVAVFTYLLVSVIQASRNKIWRRKPLVTAIQVLLMGILAWAWVTIVIDQWPCFFLGGSGC